MVGDQSSSSVSRREIEETIRASEEQLLRSRIVFAAANKTNLTDDQLVNLLLVAFPQSYSCFDRNLLTERVAKINRLSRRRDDAIDEPTSVTSKRQKLDETRNASGKNKVLSSSAPARSSDSKIGEFDPSGSNKSDDDSEMSSTYVVGNNQKMVRVLTLNGELGDGWREMDKIDEGEWRDGSGNNRPMFSDIYGMNDASTLVSMLKMEVIVPLHHMRLLHHFGLEPATRILVHGPRGCGKTMLARAIVNEAGVPSYEISAAELMSGVSGAPEERIRELFSAAYMRAPSVVFIDAIEPCIVNHLKACMEEAYRLANIVNHNADSESSNSAPGHVLLIGATNDINAIDPALRRWFDREIGIDVPNYYARHELLSALTLRHELEVGFDKDQIVDFTRGFVAGDLVALAKEARKYALKRNIWKRTDYFYNTQMFGVPFKDRLKTPFSDELENLIITMRDFWVACSIVKPSSHMEGFLITPNATWDDVVGLQSLKSNFERLIVKRIKYPEVNKDKSKFNDRNGDLFLYGPPGCGKTLIVEALANEAGASFIHVKAPQLLQYGDRIQLMVKNLFHYARTRSPCILFFDELDIMTPYDGEDGKWPDIRAVIDALSGVDYTVLKDHVFVIGATNRPEVRMQFEMVIEYFSNVLCFPLPTPEERGAILKALARNRPIDGDVDLMAIGKDNACENFYGGDLCTLMDRACEVAVDRPTYFGGGCSKTWTIKDADFKSALAKIHPSVPLSDIKEFEFRRAIWSGEYEEAEGV